MTELTKRYLEIPELPDSFPIDNSEELKKALGETMFKAFVHKNILYRLYEKSTDLFEAEPARYDTIVVTVSQLMPKDFRTELVKSFDEEKLQNQIIDLKNQVDSAERALSENFSESFVLKAIAAANGRVLQ